MSTAAAASSTGSWLVNARLELLEVVVILHFNVLFWTAFRQGWVLLWFVLGKWGKMHVHQERLGFIAVSIFSWSYFISKHLLTRYKFIPTHLSKKILKNPTHTKEPQVNYSSSSIIMWGSRPLMTVSTADISVLNTLQRLYTLPTSRVKVPKNFEPNHVWLHRDATRPLQRFSNKK